MLKFHYVRRSGLVNDIELDDPSLLMTPGTLLLMRDGNNLAALQRQVIYHFLCCGFCMTIYFRVRNSFYFVFYIVFKNMKK